jgi:flavine halogenase
LTQVEISKTVEFCFRAFAHVSFEEKEALVKKLKSLGLDGDAYDESNRKALEEVEKKLTPEEQSILKTLKGRRMVRPEDSLNIDNFTLDSIDGFAPRLERGHLGLVPAKKASVKFTTHDPLSFLNGEARAAANRTMQNGHAAPNGNGEMNGRKAINGHSTVKSAPMKPSMAELMQVEDNQSSSPPLDEATRHRLMTSLHESAEELETPYDTMLRILNAVSLQRNIPHKSCSHHYLLTVHLPVGNRVG